jgi:deoxyribonuclease I
MFKLLLSAACLFQVHVAFADSVDNYYSSLNDKSDVEAQLFKIISTNHSPISYKQAREYIFGFLYLEGNSPQTYSIETYYCNQKLTNADFGKVNQLAPMKIPDNNILNVEHSWPQSHFTSKFPKGTQKADLHILFPTLSTINSIRGNFPYGEVDKAKNTPCSEAALGNNKQGEQVFEPDDSIKGDMARATLYYVTRYNVKLNDYEEAALRRWHEMDPADAKEKKLNDQIFEIQKNRNPFIDHPELVSKVSDF